MVARAGEAAGFPFLVHSHMLRHSGLRSGERWPCRPWRAERAVSRPSAEYLTEAGVLRKLIKAAGENRSGAIGTPTAILIAYRHGLRSSELVALRWDDIDFQTGKLHVRRAKGGTASVHPIGGPNAAACDCERGRGSPRPRQPSPPCHKSINSTVRYTALAPDRFKGFWKD